MDELLKFNNNFLFLNSLKINIFDYHLQKDIFFE